MARSRTTANSLSKGREAISFQGFQSPLNMETIFREEVQTFLRSNVSPTVDSQAVMTRLRRAARGGKPRKISSSEGSSSSGTPSEATEASPTTTTSAETPAAPATTPVAPTTGEQTPSKTTQPPPAIDITASGSGQGNAPSPQPRASSPAAAPPAAITAAPAAAAEAAPAMAPAASGTSADLGADMAKQRNLFRCACRIYLKERVPAEELQDVAAELWEAALAGDLAAVVDCLDQKARSGDKEQELLINLPSNFTPKMITDILAKKCNPRPKPKAMAAPGEYAKGKAPKRKSTDAPNTSIQERADVALRRAAALTRELELEGETLLAHEARKARRAENTQLRSRSLLALAGEPAQAGREPTPPAATQPPAAQPQAPPQPPPQQPPQPQPPPPPPPRHGVVMVEPLAMETAPRLGTHHVIAHSSAATAEEPRNVEAARISIHQPPPQAPAAAAAPIDLGHVTPHAQPGVPRAAPLPPTFGDKALYDMYMWLRDCNPTWDYRQVMEETNVCLGRRVSSRDKAGTDSSSHDEAEGPFARIKGYKGSSSAKVNLPNPQKFDGDLTHIVPSHYPDADAYLEHLAKTAVRGRLPFGEIVQMHFTKTAGIWAQQFFKGELIDTTGFTIECLNNAKYNGAVYNAFHAAFMKHFAVQLRTRQQAAIDNLFRVKSYKMQPGESVPLYLARFQALCSEAGGITDDQSGYLFREGLTQSLKDRTQSDKRKRFTTLQEIYDACLVQEDVDVHKSKSTPTTNTLAYTNSNKTPNPQGPQQGWQGGRGGGGRGRGGRGGDKKMGPAKLRRMEKREQARAGAGGSTTAEQGQGKRQKRFKGKPFKATKEKRVRFNSMTECSASESRSDSEELPNPPRLNVTRSPTPGRKAPPGYAFLEGKDTLVQLPK